MHVRYSYLPQQFGDCDDLWAELKEFVKTGDFTLGGPLTEFEERFAALIGTKHAIGVNSGTDAIKLSLKSLGVGHGDEVITAANTFVATVGAIAELGATPVFVDCDDTFCMDVSLVEAKIGPKTKAIVPVHFTGYMTDMTALMHLAEKYKLPVVEDACQSILGEFDGRKAGSIGETGCFSLHPLKNLNVWSDGGVITTNDDELAAELRLLRNHGLINRDEVEILGCNSRLDTFQAVVGNWLIPSAVNISEKRIENAKYLDAGLEAIKGLRIPPRLSNCRMVFHLYMFFTERRNELLSYLLNEDIEAKVHYPIPIYRQKALKHLGHKEGDFPNTDRHASSVLSLPCDQHLSKAELDFMIQAVRSFYA
jgi:dTDP-3-amino-2,3,6-trideoxy-4-keto-D-glucose/dTDP-3-amino-3,4,6-trideoxy-alpha-D-glucose/dTDP-2,6-dideoxy-D-kanosamine transaminase